MHKNIPGTLKSFKFILQEVVGHKLSAYLISTCSNMLAIDFELKATSQNPITDKDIQEYANACSKKIYIYLGEKFMLGNNFSDALTLFAVAIAEKQNYFDEYDKEQNIDLIVQQMMNHSDLSSLEGEIQRAVRSIIKKIVISGNITDVDFLIKNIKLLINKVNQTIDKKNHKINALNHKSIEDSLVGDIAAYKQAKTSTNSK